MKKLISTEDVRQYASQGKKEIVITPDTIVTAAARDMVSELRMKLVKADAIPENTPAENEEKATDINTNTNKELDADLISIIVQKVMDKMNLAPKGPIVEKDPSGMELVKGSSVEAKSKPETGNKVLVKDLITADNNLPIKAGVVALNSGAFSRKFACDEVNYVVEGNLEVTVGNKTYLTTAGDVLFIPRNTEVAFASPDQAKLFYVAFNY